MFEFMVVAVTSLVAYVVGHQVGYAQGITDSLDVMQSCMDEVKTLAESENDGVSESVEASESVDE